MRPSSGFSLKAHCTLHLWRAVEALDYRDVLGGC